MLKIIFPETEPFKDKYYKLFAVSPGKNVKFYGINEITLY